MQHVGEADAGVSGLDWSPCKLWKSDARLLRQVHSRQGDAYHQFQPQSGTPTYSGCDKYLLH